MNSITLGCNLCFVKCSLGSVSLVNIVRICGIGIGLLAQIRKISGSLVISEKELMTVFAEKLVRIRI